MSIYRISKSLLVPLQTPDANAMEGMKNAPESNASKPAVSPSVVRRMMAPVLTNRVTINPASHCAGSCRNSGEADENVICCTLW